MEKLKDPRAEAELRIGQALCALGQGAGPARISRSAVAAFRERYLDIFALRIEEDCAEGHDKWTIEGPNVLDRARSVGRLAAHLSLCQGAMAIEERHLTSAAEQIEKYHLGRYCEFPSNEKVLLAARQTMLAGVEGAGLH
jgi:hypothetical protein